MFAFLEPTVGKQKSKGRPTKEEGPGNTRLIRAFEDIADMIAWIVRVEGGTTANLIDPMLRPEVVARYEKHKDTIDRIKKAEEEVKRVEEEEAKKRDQAKPRKK